MWRLQQKRKTKIVCTLGPASRGETLPRLLEAGMDVARLNFSHGSQEEHGRLIKTLRQLAQEQNHPLAIMQDLSGPKIRIGRFEKGQVELQKGQKFTLTSAAVVGNQEKVSVGSPELVSEAPLGAQIFLQDGLITLAVENKTTNSLHCRVVEGGNLRSRVGVNLPEYSLSISALTSKDQEDLKFGAEMGVDFIALSYVRQAREVLQVKELARSWGSDIPVIAKIEKHESLSNLSDILKAADGLMVARGDLGVEVPLEQVPLIQKQIIREANRVGKPVITATQMLLSMVNNPRPSRAEATDVANAILDGTDAVMLSEETAIGRYPEEAVRFLDKLARAAEASFPYKEWLQARAPEPRATIEDAISFAACALANDLEAAAIITSTNSGATARLISRFRPRTPLIGVSSRKATWRQLSLTWGVFPLETSELRDTEHMVKVVEERATEVGWLSKGEKVVITAGTPFGKRGVTNFIKADII
ncbi:MAG: pyruvate kinase [Desulfobacteraceae bacterium]